MPQTVADHPALAALWDTANNSEPAAAVAVTSKRLASWACPRGHAFQRAPHMLLRDPKCPQCKVSKEGTSLVEKRPSLAALWHPEKNGAVRPENVDSASTVDRWWRCASGHSFQRDPLQMLRNAECPLCALAATSLAALHPTVAAEWSSTRNGDLTPEMVEADHIMSAWWTCPRGHDYQATVRSRAGGVQCPKCYAGWSVDHIRAFVQALLAHVGAFDPSEKYALAMQAGLLKDKDSRPFIMALTSGRFPRSELEKFAKGEASAVDGFRGDLPDSRSVLELVMPEPPNTPKPDDRFALPSAPEPEDVVRIDLEQVVDVSETVDVHGSTTEVVGDAPLPVVTTHDALRALDSDLIASADAETVKFLIDSAKAKLWRHAYLDASEARAQAASFVGDVYSSHVRDMFLAEFDEAQALAVPTGYRFEVDGKVILPNLMQRRVAVRVRQTRRFGNWSGMGAGKTLSAVLSTRVVGANLTVICCPNAVVKGWNDEITKAFSNCDIAAKNWLPSWSDPLGGKPRYLIMNYEQFQQPDSESNLVAFLERNVVDFIVIDEIHYAKQRDLGAEMSRRKRLVQGLVLEGAKKNPDLFVLGMSGTPVINSLQEGRSLVELITGHRHDDLETAATVQNCMRLYQRLVTLGTRWKPNYAIQLDVRKEEIDAADHIEDIRAAGEKILDLEKVLTRVRLPTILENIQPGEKVLIYTHYVEGISRILFDAVSNAGYRPGLLTGETDSADLEEFKKPAGTVDVLVASSRIGTGVDGLQHVCKKLIINCLPWTNAEYEQLIGRLYRQGSKFERVEVIIPATFAMVNGERWSYCESKLQRLEYKKSIADAAVDGVVPEGNLRSPTQAQQDIMSWLARLEDGAVETITRRRIVIPLSGEPSDVSRRVLAYGDFTRINNHWYASASQKTHARLQLNAEEWAHYHTLYREARQSWPVVPFEEEIRWLEARDPIVVGDFGCGEAIIAERLGAKHDVRSFDHVAVNPSVVACDITAVPLDDGALDLAIFCLSLMGSNFTDYIREAHRCLRLDGRLHIWEAASYFEDVSAFCAGLAKLGFEVMAPKQVGLFVQIHAVKASTKAAPNLVLPFRGNATPTAR